jgi:hypothetical protein
LKIGASGIIQSLISQVRGIEAAARPRPVKDAFIEPDVAAGVFDARKRLDLLHQLIGNSLAKEAGLAGDNRVPDAPLRPHELVISRKILEELSRREEQFPGRLWDAGTANGSDYAQEFLKSALQTGDLRAAGAQAAKATGFAERYEPTLDDVENALIQLGVMPAHLASRQRREAEPGFAWLRYFAIAVCFSILGAVVVSVL